MRTDRIGAKAAWAQDLASLRRASVHGGPWCVVAAAAAALAGGLLGGCAPDDAHSSASASASASVAPTGDVRARLREAYRQLDGPRPDYAAMVAAANAFLAEHPTGDGADEACYLRGRAFEEKAQQDPGSPDADLAAAAAAYQRAIEMAPRAALEGLIRAGLGNVYYFQGRFPSAINELSSAVAHLERPADRAWALYRVGVCQQRVAQWDAADRTFAAVGSQYPGTEQARRAAEHAGQRAFWVQVATFAVPTQADAAVLDLKKQGLPAGKFADATRPGVQLVRVGPMTTYDAANTVKQRVWSKYASAMIVP